MEKIFKKFFGKKILIAEDYMINQEVIQEILKLMGFAVIDLAENGIEALEQYNENDYDVILMDIQMPEKDGYEAAKEIRKREEGSAKHTIIIALTANALIEDKERCLAAGMDAYISKPIEVKKLADILDQYID
ncbi:MAG: response regulator [Waddliaceae bacterium]